MKKKVLITIISIITILAMLISASYAKITYVNGMELPQDNSPQAVELRKQAEALEAQVEKARQIEREGRTPTAEEIAEYNKVVSDYNAAIEAYKEYRANQGNKPTPTNTPVPTNTPIPTNTPVPTNTPIPTNTPNPTNIPIPTSVPNPTGSTDITTPIISEEEARLQSRYDELSREIWETQNIQHKEVDPEILKEYNETITKLDDIQKTKPGYTPKNIWISNDLSYEKMRQDIAKGNITTEDLDKYVKEGKMSQDAYEHFKNERQMYLEYQDRQSSSGNSSITLTEKEKLELKALQDERKNGNNGGSNIGGNNTLDSAETIRINALEEKRKDLEATMRECEEKGIEVEPEVLKEYNQTINELNDLKGNPDGGKIEWDGVNFYSLGQEAKQGTMTKEQLDEYLKNGNINKPAYNHLRRELQESLEDKFEKNTITAEQKANLQAIYEEKYDANELTLAEKKNLQTIYEEKEKAGTLSDKEKEKLEKIRKETGKDNNDNSSDTNKKNDDGPSLGKETSRKNAIFKLSLPVFNIGNGVIMYEKQGGFSFDYNSLINNNGSWSNILCRQHPGTLFNYIDTKVPLRNEYLPILNEIRKVYDYGTRNPGSVNETTRTATIYKEASNETAGRNDRWDIAYILNHIEENSGANSDVQMAYWSIANEGTDTPEYNYIALEAKAFNAYKEELKAQGGFKQSDSLTNQKVAFNGEKEQAIAGPLKINYVRGAAKVEGHDKVNFGGIESITVYDQNGNKLEQNTWKITYDKQHKDTSKEEEKKANGDFGQEGGYGAVGLDGWFNYPYGGEEFNIVIDTKTNKTLRTIGKVIIEFYDTNYYAEYKNLNGTYKEINWKVNRKQCTKAGTAFPPKFDPITGTWQYPAKPVCPEHGLTGTHYIYELEGTVGSGSNEAQRLTIVTGGGKETTTTVYTVDVPIMPTIPPIVPRIPSIIAGIPPAIIPIIPDPDIPDIPDIPTPTVPTPTPFHVRMTLSGVVWEDSQTGKESESDNIIGNKNDGSQESGIANVIVTLYDAKTNQKVPVGDNGVAQNPVTTDRYGAYYFLEVPMGQYYVEFTYDGLTYTSVEPYAKENGTGSAADYKLNPNDYIKSSKAAETTQAREEFNERFYEISGNGQQTSGGTSYGVAKNRNGLVTANLEYKTSNGVSKLITTDSSGKPLEPFQMTVRTGEVYPFTKLYTNETTNITIDDETFKANYPYMTYINLGLKRRPEADVAVMKDVSTATVTINKKQFDYAYNRRSETKGFDIYLRKDSDYSNIVYNRQIYKSDYTYRIDDYATNNFEENTVSASAIKGLKNQDNELKVFVTYKMTIRNQSGIPAVGINELYDYFDNTYKLVGTGTGPYEEPEVNIEIQDENKVTSMKKVAARSYYETEGAIKQTGYIDWEVTGEAKGKYIKMKTNSLKDVILESGEDINIYVTFEVSKNNTRAINYGEKGNYMEVNSYSVYNSGATNSTAKAFGQVDRDSAPGNFDMNNEATHEDDSDTAPTINITIDEKQEQRTLNGVVWEDERTQTISQTGQIVGDGKKQSSEKEVKDVIVQLVELIDNPSDPSKPYEYIWQEMYTGANSLKYVDSKDGNIYDRDLGAISDYSYGSMSTGGYKFRNYIPGNYVVRFKYGEEPKQILDNDAHNGKSYNGHDYKSTAYQTGFNRLNEEWYDLANDNLSSANISDAKDNEARRIKVIGYSGGSSQGGNMKYDTANVLYAVENKKTELYDTLCKNTWMYADTAKIKVEVEYNRTKASDIETLPEYKVPNIDFGIEERPRNSLEYTKEITGIKITTASGDVIVDTVKGIRKNVQWTSSNKKARQIENKGKVTIHMDEELMQGMTVEISYKMTIKNKGEIDTVGRVENQEVKSLGNTYYTGQYDANTQIVTTAYDRVLDYVDNSLVFKADVNPDWQLIEKDSQLQSVANMKSNGFLKPDLAIAKYTTINGKRQLVEANQVIVSKKLNEPLLPEVSKSGNSSNTVELVLSKTITGQDIADDLAYDNTTELIQFTNLVGRKAYIPGDTGPENANTMKKTTYEDREHDFDYTETVVITPPTGENRATYYLLIGAGALIVLAGGIIVIKKKVIRK